MRKLISPLLFCIFLVQPLWAQVTDDSTKNVYGPKTTLYTTEDDVLNNKSLYRSLDTTLTDQHKWDLVELNSYYWQYLGTVGTAMQPIYYQAPAITGRRSGFSVYDPYTKNPEDFKYFDTKSPYTQLRSVIGGNYRAFVGIDFSRNVLPNWNVGFSFNRWTIDKQIGPNRSRGDLNALSLSYDIYTDYQTPNKKYRVLFNFARTYHKVYETGGIVDVDTVLLFDNLFDYEDEEINLRNAESSQLTQRYHLYQQYNFSKLVNFYHSLDWQRRLNQFVNPAGLRDQPVDVDEQYFDRFLVRSDSSQDLATTYSIKNDIGLKGDLGKLFYRLYVSRRDVRYSLKYDPELLIATEYYGGAYARIALNEQWQLTAEAQYQIDGNYRLQAVLKTPYLRVSALSMQFDAPYFHQRYYGNHDFWRNNFVSEQVQQVKAKAYFGLGKALKLEPKLELTVVGKHIYLNEQAEPAQTKEIASLIHPGLELISQLGNFNFNVDYIYTIKEGKAANLFRIPEHFLTVGIYYERLIAGTLIGRVGIDAHLQSGYFADDYDPTTQHYFLQNDFEIPAYGFGDIYLSFKFNTASVFFKYRHLNQGLNAPGYFATPYYSGQQAVFDLGVTWSFYD
ncbi:MAG: hypothetical protein ACJAT1_000952 [Marivirga sp.]